MPASNSSFGRPGSPPLPRRLSLVLAAVLLGPFPGQPAAAPAPGLNFAEGLQKSLYFFEAQRSGRLPPGQRVEWRGDSCMFDGRDVGLDLTGGLYDAGDQLKRNTIAGFAAGLLAWSAVEYPDAYKKSGQFPHLLDTLRWVNDYFLNCIVRDAQDNFEVYVEVGDAAQDHAFWAPAEVVHLLTPVRPSYKVTPQCPGTDVLANMAGAMAASSIVFREQGQPAYADHLVEMAEKLYKMADRHPNAGLKMDARGRILGRSHSDYFDELLWACAWLHMAKNVQNPGFGRFYLDAAIALYNSIGFDGRQLRHWEDFNFSDLGKGAFLLLAKLTDDPHFHREIQRHLDWWTVGITDKAGRTPGGLAFNSPDRQRLLHAGLGQACNEAFLAFVYGDWTRNQQLKQRYLDFARGQILYALGQNPSRQSYAVGYGPNPPRIVSHATAHGPYAGLAHLNPARPEYRLEARHVLYGALIGGPDKNDHLDENSIEPAQREPRLDSNATFTGCLARMFLETGASDRPLENFPEPEKREEEFFVEAGIASVSDVHLELIARVHNHSAWPARVADGLSIRYFLTLEPNAVPPMLSVGTISSAGAKIPPKIQHFRGDTYFAEVNFSGIPIFPGGLEARPGSQPLYRRDVRFRINHPKTWNNRLDWSYAGLAPKGKTPVRTTRICLYDDGRLIFGEEPPPDGPKP